MKLERGVLKVSRNITKGGAILRNPVYSFFVERAIFKPKEKLPTTIDKFQNLEIMFRKVLFTLHKNTSDCLIAREGWVE